MVPGKILDYHPPYLKLQYDSVQGGHVKTSQTVHRASEAPFCTGRVKLKEGPMCKMNVFTMRNFKSVFTSKYVPEKIVNMCMANYS
jgi:hypothetical protein